MSWFDLRNNSPDPNAALLRSLIQAKIDDEIQAHEPEDSEHLEQGVDTYSSMNISDNLSWSFLRDISLASSARNYIPNEPDLDKLRLWTKNENGGHILKDHAKMGNIINILGKNPPTLVKIGDQDGLTGNRLCNAFDGNQELAGFFSQTNLGGQFLRISDNPNIRIKELLTTDSISIFCRIYLVTPHLDLTKNAVLFSKIDDEQATNGYMAQIDEDGNVYFFVRKDSRERCIKTTESIFQFYQKADYQSPYYHSQYYKTSAGLTSNPFGIPMSFMDLVFTCSFSADMAMTIKKDGVTVADTSTLHDDNLVGAWRLNEGGNIGTTTQEQTPTQRIAYDSSSLSSPHNGTINNALWVTNIPPFEDVASFLNFDGSNDYVLVSNYSEIQNITAFSISFWYYHKGLPNVDQYMIYKGTVGAANSFLVYAQTTGFVRLSIWNNSTVRHDISFNSAFPTLNTWYHIVAKWTMGSTGKVFVDNVKVTGGANIAGSLSTGTSNMIIGGGTGVAPLGVLHDVKVWNREISDSEVTLLYDQGHTPSTFPPWKADPLLPSESPSPITNPFAQYYNVPWSAGQDTTKLHTRVISGFTNFYDTNDDADIPGSQQTLPYNAIYDVQPAGGGGGGGTPADVYNVAISSGQHLEFESGVTRGGVRFLAGHACIGQRVTSVTVRFRKMSNPGTISVGIRKYSDGSFVSLGSFNASSYGSGEQSATVTNAGNSYAMVANDIVSIEGGDDSVELTQNDGAGQPSSTDSVEYDGSWGSSGYTLSCVIQAVAGGAASGGIPLLKPWNERGLFDPMQSTRTGEAITSTAATWGIGKKITKVVVQMTKMGSPGGTIYCKVFKGGSTTNTLQIGTSKTAADIPATQGNVTFEWATEAERAAQTYALVSGDIIGIEVVGGSISDTNYYIVHHNDTSSIANAHVKYYNNISPSTGWQWTYYTGGSSSTNTAKEMVGQWYDGGFSATIATVYAHIKLDHLTTRAAENFATGSAGIGKAITKISPRFKKFGNPIGSVSVVIRNSAGTQMTSFGTIDAVADIPAGDVWTQKDFTNLANARTCAAGDRISVEYGAGDANNYVMVSMNLNHDNFDASLSYAQQWLAAGSSYTNPGAAPGVTTYDLAGIMATGGIATDPLGRTRVGQRCNSPTSVMRGKKVTRAIIALHKIGTPPADTYVTVRIRKAGTDAIAATVGQILASSLPAGTATWKTVENVNNVYIMQQNDVLSIEYDYGDDSNYVVLTRTNADVFEATGNLSQAVDFNAPNYNALATSDLFGELWTGGDTYTPAIDEQVIRDPIYHHDLLVGAGGSDWSYYAAVGTITNHIGINVISEFRIYRRELTAAQALNLFTNRCTITSLDLSEVAKVGTFGVAENPP